MHPGPTWRGGGRGGPWMGARQLGMWCCLPIGSRLPSLPPTPPPPALCRRAGYQLRHVVSGDGHSQRASTALVAALPGMHA